MICKVCRFEKEDESVNNEVCESCYRYMKVNKNIMKFAILMIEHDIDFSIETFGNGEGRFINFGEGIVLNFHNAGRIAFEYDKDLLEENKE